MPTRGPGITRPRVHRGVAPRPRACDARKGTSMRRQRLIATVVVMALVTGCAGPTATILPARDDGPTPPVPADIVGTWRGAYWQLGANYYADDADCVLQIKPDWMF